jgi:RES domain-containing protein
VTVSAWRIVKAKHAADAFSGAGARVFGGRWNSRGVAVVYAAGSPALAMLESLVHLDSSDLVARYLLFQVTFDASLVTALDAKALPSNWREEPPPIAVQRLGDVWVSQARSAVLRVPSVVLPTEEWNYVLNPAHPDYGKITKGPQLAARFDPRLLKTLGK